MSEPAFPKPGSWFGTPSTWSFAPPPMPRSAPLPPYRVSAPRPPSIRSLPRPPMIRSGPRSPTIALSPFRPQMTSRSGVPRCTSLPFVPMIVQPEVAPAGVVGRRASAGTESASAQASSITQRNRPTSLLGGAGLHHLADGVDDLGVGERRAVAERATARDVTEQPAHDLARTRLRQLVGEDDAVRPRDLPDLVGDVVAQLGRHVVVADDAALRRDERDDRLAVDVVRARDHGGLGDL